MQEQSRTQARAAGVCSVYWQARRTQAAVGRGSIHNFNNRSLSGAAAARDGTGIVALRELRKKHATSHFAASLYDV